MILKKTRGIKYIYILHDIHPDSSVTLGYIKEKALVKRIWDWMNQFAFKEADFIIVLGEYMRGTFEKRFKEYSHKVRVIHNWADGTFIRPMEKSDNWFLKKHGLDNKFIVLYSGSLGGYHDLETVILVAEKLKHYKDIKFIFIGEGNKKRKVLQMARDLKLPNISFLPYQPREYLPYSLTCGDISIVTLEKGLEGLAVPCKLYTSLAAGLAVWGLVGKRSEIADIIQRYRCGFRTDQNDVDSPLEMLTTLYNDRKLLKELKENSRRCFEANFDKRIAVQKYFDLLTQVQ
jgi:glycosyltransferase involved in cell wall biosynthesis